MAKKTAPAGTYILTGEAFNVQEEDGSWTMYENGDEVELTAKEAARLLTGPITSFVKKVNKDNSDTSSEPDSDTSEKPQLREMNK